MDWSNWPLIRMNRIKKAIYKRQATQGRKKTLQWHFLWWKDIRCHVEMRFRSYQTFYVVYGEDGFTELIDNSLDNISIQFSGQKRVRFCGKCYYLYMPPPFLETWNRFLIFLLRNFIFADMKTHLKKQNISTEFECMQHLCYFLATTSIVKRHRFSQMSNIVGDHALFNPISLPCPQGKTRSDSDRTNRNMLDGLPPISMFRLLRGVRCHWTKESLSRCLLWDSMPILGSIYEDNTPDWLHSIWKLV